MIRFRMALVLALIAWGLLAAAATAQTSAAVAWETDCNDVAGWHFDPGMNAKVEQDEPSVIKVTQSGNDTWGKVAYVVENIDLDATPILEVNAGQVDFDSAFMINVAPRDWSEMLTVIPRSNDGGVHTGNIKDAIRKSKNIAAWKSPATFNVVIVIEGKDRSTTFESLKIRAKQQKSPSAKTPRNEPRGLLFARRAPGIGSERTASGL